MALAVKRLAYIWFNFMLFAIPKRKSIEKKIKNLDRQNKLQ